MTRQAELPLNQRRTVPFDAPTLARLERVRAICPVQEGAAKASLAAVIRAAVERGLKDIEREQGCSQKAT
jgi:hypothetical protein